VVLGSGGEGGMKIHHRITIPEPIISALRAHLLQGDKEEVALLFGHQVRTKRTRGVVVSRWMPVPMEALLCHERDRFSVDAGFLVRTAKVARAREESILLAHNHPGDLGIPSFSHADARGERDLYTFLNVRLPDRVHGAVLITPGGSVGRVELGSTVAQPAAIRIVGRRSRTYDPTKDRKGVEPDSAHARQELIWGSHGQDLLRGARIGLVGAGGTGSVVAQQLIHLGVGALVVIDPQIAVGSNLARIVGMRASDIDHTAKVEIVKRTARLVDRRVRVHSIQGDISCDRVLRELLDMDLLFLCTDGHYSRAIVNALAVQYRIPLVDMAFEIAMNADGTRVSSATGEIRLVVPGGYCLSCAGALDADRIRAEQASPEERTAFPGYFVNLDIDDPSVITLNSAVASHAVSLGMDMLVPVMRSGTPVDSYQYNALKGLVRYEPKRYDPSCGICGEDGIGSLADDHPLPSSSQKTQ
jgi:molybdopterin-synthase adenylyltransferase